MKVLCIGKSCIETTCVINERLEEGKTITIENKTECSGGLIGNIAYLLGKWGAEVYIASMLGADDGATKIKKDFETIGVKTDYIETSFDKKTAQIISIVNETTKNKTILDIVTNSFLKKYSFGIEPDVIVSDGNDFNALVSAYDRYPKVPSYLVVTHTNSEMLELCKYGGTLIINKGAAETISGMKFDYNNSATLVNIYNKLKQRFSKSEIIITLKERGSLYSINGQVKIMPTITTAIVDTNGAKDTFVGAFVYGMGRNFGLEKSIAYATIAASISTTRLTSRNSIPSLTEVSTYYDSKFGPQNNPNNDNTNTQTGTTENNKETTSEPANQTVSVSNPVETPENKVEQTSSPSFENQEKSENDDGNGAVNLNVN